MCYWRSSSTTYFLCKLSSWISHLTLLAHFSISWRKHSLSTTSFPRQDSFILLKSGCNDWCNNKEHSPDTKSLESRAERIKRRFRKREETTTWSHWSMNADGEAKSAFFSSVYVCVEWMRQLLMYKSSFANFLSLCGFRFFKEIAWKKNLKDTKRKSEEIVIIFFFLCVVIHKVFVLFLLSFIFSDVMSRKLLSIRFLKKSRLCSLSLFALL